MMTFESLDVVMEAIPVTLGATEIKITHYINIFAVSYFQA